MRQEIKFLDIEKIEIIMGSAHESIADVKKASGCDYIINFGTYVMTTRECDSGIKYKGSLLKSGYTCEGFGIMKNRLAWSYEGQGYYEWIGQWNAYIKDNRLCRATYNDENAWIGIGINDDSVVIAGTPKSRPLSSKAFMEGNFWDCSHAILGDGSYSAQWITPEERNVTTRNVMWYIGIWLDEKSEKKEEKRASMNVKAKTKTVVYTADGVLEKNRYIDKGDLCVIEPTVTRNMLVKITYPVSSGTRTAYIKDLGNFITA